MSRDWRWQDVVELPLPLRMLNRLPMSAARRLVSLDPDSIVAKARKQAGSNELGTIDFRDGLDALTESLESDAQLSPFGRVGMRQNLVDSLAARAEVLAWHRREPSIADEEITAPLVVIGLPRTGTTLLSNLLQQDMRLRTLRYWEAATPTPPPTLVEETTDPRVRAAEKQLAGLWKIAPGFRAVHPMEPAGATECVTPLAQAMASMQFETQCHVPGYGEWMNGADLGPAYAYHRQVLQLLQWRSPGERWNLKSPAHLLGLEALLATYPDAKLIWTHRDPVDMVASVASLNCGLQSIMSDDVDAASRGTLWLDRLGTLVDRGMATLDAHPEAEIAHIDYRHMIAEPVQTITAAYDTVGLPMDDIAQRRMQAWMDANPQNKWGRHRYDAAEFGLDPDQVRDRFSDYRERFDLE